MANVLRRATFIGRLRYLLFDRYYNRLMPITMVILCLAATLLSALLWSVMNRGGSPILGLIPVVVLGGISFLTILYNNMERYALLILLVTTMVSDGISTGTDTKITFGITLIGIWTGLWLFKLVVVERKIVVRPSPSNIPALAFMVVTVISLFWSGEFAEANVMFMYDDKVAVRLMTTVVIILSFFTYFLYANNIHTIKTLRDISWLFIMIGGLFVILNIFNERVPPPFNAKGQFSAWVSIFALGQALFNHQIQKWLRAVLLAIVAGWVVSTVFLGLGLSWLSGWVPVGVGCLVLLFLYSRRLFVLVLLVLITVYIANQVALQSVAEAENMESGTTRLDAWFKVIDLTLKHPLLGTGPAGYYFYFTVNIGGFFQLSHNNYVDVFAQTGIVGLTIWMIFWAGAGLMTLRMYRTIPRNNNFEHGLAFTLVAAYFCTIVTMMLGDWVTPFPYTQTLSGVDYTIWAWMLAGMTVALYHIHQERSAADTDTATDNHSDPIMLQAEHTPI